MAIRFYNTITREKDEFREIEKGKVKIYSCGPTVYNFAHIGNLRAFTFADVLRRYLKYRGYEVIHVMNLTDVDDKTIRDSQKEGISLKEFTERYTKYFFEDLDKLNIERVEHYPKATESIKAMVEIIKRLLDKGIAYKSEDGSVYYDVSKFEGYGKLSKLNLKSLKSGARVKNDEYEKGSAQDFALWKAYDADDGDVYWDTEFGKGRPGWHIECSAMSMKFLGAHFDIHTGGIDLIFPHHENEIAQSEGCNAERFVNYWLHSEHLLVEGEKMSKSKGNFFTLRDILEKGYSPKAIRYLLLSTHYRQQLNFSFDALSSAERVISKIQEFLIKLRSISSDNHSTDADKLIEDTKKSFDEAMDDDLNISSALSSLFEFMTEVNKRMASSSISRDDALKFFNLMMELDKVLGIMDFMQDKIPPEIMSLAEKREEARKKKDWKLSDLLRDQIKEKGYAIEDTGSGPMIKKL